MWYAIAALGVVASVIVLSFVDYKAKLSISMFLFVFVVIAIAYFMFNDVEEQPMSEEQKQSTLVATREKWASRSEADR